MSQCSKKKLAAVKNCENPKSACGHDFVVPPKSGDVPGNCAILAVDGDAEAMHTETERALMAKIGSQPLKWHGGKSYQAARIHALAPPSVHDDRRRGYTHRNIVFAGGLGEFWNWLPIDGISETVNDIDGELINFYLALREPESFQEFERLVSLTPFSDTEFKRAVEAQHIGDGDAQTNVQRAVNVFVGYRMSRQGIGRDYATPTKRTRRGMNEQVSAYLSAIDGLPACAERLRRVELCSVDFRDFLRKYDHPRALHHCDPPYLHETRTSIGEYGAHEMSLEDHRDLLQVLADVEGKFMLHGYPSQLYDSWATDHGWRCDKLEIDNKASSAKSKPKRMECIWMNY